jgi:hypothetical protein
VEIESPKDGAQQFTQEPLLMKVFVPAYIERISDTLHVVNRVHIVKHENMLYDCTFFFFHPFTLNFAAVQLARALIEQEKKCYKI